MINGKQKISIFFALLLFVFIGTYLISLRSNQESLLVEDSLEVPYTNNIEINGQKFDLTLAISPQDAARGLSGTTSLPINEGMLFVFKVPGTHGFWMKDMNFAIDIIWISGDNKIVHIQHDATPESFPEVFEPNDPAVYVLEINSGLSREHGFEIGTNITFLPNSEA
ncbi:hypothetical protein COB64_04640 [Candidatus Wolfebacteria bacterium]|nr:MAG: hypothetical protein COB64_04640 [Candidatus Wolfebacteria bacterium]